MVYLQFSCFFFFSQLTNSDRSGCVIDLKKSTWKKTNADWSWKIFICSRILWPVWLISEITRHKNDPQSPHISLHPLQKNWHNVSTGTVFFLYRTSFWIFENPSAAKRPAAKYKQTPWRITPSPPKKTNHLTWFHNFFSLTCKLFQINPFWFLSWSCHSFVSPNLHRLTAVSQTFSLISKILHFYLGKNNFILEIILSWEQFFLENIQVGLNWPNSRNLAQLDAISQNFHSSWIIFASCLFFFLEKVIKKQANMLLVYGFYLTKTRSNGLTEVLFTFLNFWFCFQVGWATRYTGLSRWPEFFWWERRTGVTSTGIGCLTG